MLPEMVTLPVARITVPLGTVSVTPEFTPKLVNCVLAGGSAVQYAVPTRVYAPPEPSP
jgi:hypothetical protein